MTSTPAACIGRGDELGTLAPGGAADLTLLRLVRGEFRLFDSHNVAEVAEVRLEPVSVVRAGRPLTCTTAAFC